MNREQFRLGIRHALPIVPGYVPLCTAFGILARSNHFPSYLAGLFLAAIPTFLMAMKTKSLLYTLLVGIATMAILNALD